MHYFVELSAFVYHLPFLLLDFFPLDLTLISSLINVLVSDLQQRRRLYISLELSGHSFKIYMNTKKIIIKRKRICFAERVIKKIDISERGNTATLKYERGRKIVPETDSKAEKRRQISMLTA